jgi:hypothetical protein
VRVTANPSAWICRMWLRSLRSVSRRAWVVAVAEVGEPGGGVGQQVPDDEQDGAGHGDLGFGLAAAASDPVVALAEEGGGAKANIRRRARDHIRGLERLGYQVTIEALNPDPETGALPVTRAS